MGPARRLPQGLVGRTDRESVEDEVAAARGHPPGDGEVLDSLCRMAAEVIAQHPDPGKALRWQDPVSPATEQMLARLRRDFRRGI